MEMEYSYLNHYKIIQTYKDNEFQKVFVATKKDSNEAVVINNIYINENNPPWPLDGEDYRELFNNIAYLEQGDREIVLVSKVSEGFTLNEYLRDFKPGFTERVDLVYQYLSSIKKYDPLPNKAKSILVDESQLIVDGGKLGFGELIIFNEASFNIRDFGPVKDNIISVMQELTSLPNIDYGELPLYIKVVGFIDEVRKDSRTYNSIESIFKAFEGLGIGHFLTSAKLEDSSLFSRPSIEKDTGLAGDRPGLAGKEASGPGLASDSGPGGLGPSGGGGLGAGGPMDSMDRTGGPSLPVTTGKNIGLSLAIGGAGLVVALLVAWFVFRPVINSNGNSTNAGPGPSKDVVDVRPGSPGDENSGQEPLDELSQPSDHISHVDETIEKDFTDSKYSSFSYRISGDKARSHKISLDQGPIKANSQVLMWIKSDTGSSFDVAVQVYSNGNLTFKQSVLYKPSRPDNWELVRFSLTKDIKGPFDIVFSNVEGRLWLDRISIDFFK